MCSKKVISLMGYMKLDPTSTQRGQIDRNKSMTNQNVGSSGSIDTVNTGVHEVIQTELMTLLIQSSTM